MPRSVKPLSDTDCRNSKPRTKAYKLFDGGGLYLEVRPGGGRFWRLKYRTGGLEKHLHIGPYPAIGLKAAREKVQEARAALANGIDPVAARKPLKTPESFASVAEEWLKKRQTVLAPATTRKIRGCLDNDLLPWLGPRPVNAIEAPELLACLRRMESRGAIESSHRGRQVASQVFRYGVACGYAKRDPAADLKDALSPVRTTHRAAITDPAGIGELLRAIDSFSGSFTVKCALSLAPLLFPRPGELRSMEWSELDLDQQIWRLPAGRMKMRREHVVPLSTQALAILNELYPLTGKDRFVFPSERTRDKSISENTLNAALRRMGYSREQMTAHGFRALASTRLHELGYSAQVIEAQLAHAKRDKVAAAYNRAEHLPERVTLMQQWADYLDGLRRGAEIVTLRRA